MSANRDLLEQYVELYNAGDLDACMELVQLRDGQIVVDNLYYDMVAALFQLGLVPQGAAA